MILNHTVEATERVERLPLYALVVAGSARRYVGTPIIVNQFSDRLAAHCTIPRLDETEWSLVASIVHTREHCRSRDSRTVHNRRAACDSSRIVAIPATILATFRHGNHVGRGE